jgi:imidazole glycerol phosphate synthase subunit HisF
LRERVGVYMEALTRPPIVKVGLRDAPGTEEGIGQLVQLGVECVHANVGDVTAAAGQAAIRQLSEYVPFLIAGGKIKAAEDALRALDAGADAVAIGTAAMHDPGLCGRLQGELRGAGP